MNKLSLILVCGGAVALALSLVMGWLGVAQIVKAQIKKGARLAKDRDTYNMWKGGPTSVPILIKFYFFNVTNPDEVTGGTKPKVSEIGPYTYALKWRKVDISPGNRNHTWEYRNKKSFHFRPSLSSGSEQDFLTFINVPLLIVAKLTSELEDVGSIHEGLESKVAEAGDGLFKTASVRELLLDGIPIEPYLDFLKVYESNDTKIPTGFFDGKYALLDGQNGVENVLYEVNNGQGNYKDFAKFEARDNKTLLPWWGNETCNSLNGSDGTMFLPFLTREAILPVYSFDFCRSYNYTYEKDVEFEGVPGYRFKPEPKLLQSPEKNPENWCYCVDSDEKLCNRNGLLSISACSEGAPIVMSLPHFYQTEPSIIESVDGMKPGEDLHATFIDIEPGTGKVLRAAKRVQMNVDLIQNPQMKMMANVQSVAFPVMWTEEYTALTKKHLKWFAQIESIGKYTELVRWPMVFASLISVLLGIIVGMLRRDKIPHQVMR